MMKMIKSLLLISSLIVSSTSQVIISNNTSISLEEGIVCDIPIPYDEGKHKQREFTVGVLAIRGFDAAYNEFNKTFNEYLTATAGQRFNPPISFRLQPLNFLTLFSSVEDFSLDFIYVNPSAYSCIESEYEAHSLASQISQRKIKGYTYNLKKFGGIIFTLANRTDIQSINDLKDQKIAAASISGLGSGQMQFKQMVDNGMNYLQDPKQLIFTSNQGLVVQGVLSGEFDVGFVRTDQLERTKDELTGLSIDLTKLKVIDPKPDLSIDGEPFPFESSTELYAEWNIASLKHVATDVSLAVQRAMYRVGDYGKIGNFIRECYETHNTTYCDAQTLSSFIQQETAATTTVQCGTTTERAVLASEAMEQGKYAGWTTTLSYMPLRSMQQATGFIEMEPDTKIWRCIRAAEIYDAISCPAGSLKKSKNQVDTGCSDLGLTCREGFQCVCRPCDLPNELLCVDSIKINDQCVSLSVFLPIIILSFLTVIALSVMIYLRYKKQQIDSIWRIDPQELIFDEPVRCIGQGSFGMVLLADYRGTQVAVKRVMPQRRGSRKKKAVLDPQGFLATVQSTSSNEDASGFDVENPGMMRNHWGRSFFFDNGKTAKSLFGLQCTPDQEYETAKQQFVSEIRYLSKLRHPSISTVVGAVMPSNGSEPMLVMEYMPHGSLWDVLQDETMSLQSDQLLGMLQDVAQGLRFLHGSRPKVIHRDLKAINILVDANFKAKVANFGMPSRSKAKAIGTPYWMAPELLNEESGNTTASDVYSFGILIYELYSGRPPYEGENYAEVIREIRDPNIRKRPIAPIHCPQRVASLMQDCIRHDPLMRPSAEHLDLQLKVELKVNERTTRLEQLNRDLEAANEQIASASAMQLQHFASMSHEIRTPLNCIIGLSSLLEETKLDPMQQENIDMIVNSGQLLRSIVDDVLDYSKLESGNAETFVERINLQETLDVVVHMIKRNELTQQKQLEIRTHYDPVLPQFIQADSRRMQQIVFNLFGNAIKFSKDKRPVEFSTEIIDSRILRLTVKDFGKGIEAKDYGKIFEPFRQTASGLTNVSGGTGLGLAITKKLVTALKGHISVESVVGEWTEFTVDFPFQDEPVDIDEVSSQLQKTKVLLVVDRESEEAKAAINVLKTYKIRHSIFSSMHEIGSLSNESGTFVCLCHETLFIGLAHEILEKTNKYSLITFGPDFSVKSSKRHFRGLEETFPSVLTWTMRLLAGQLMGESHTVDSSVRSHLTSSAPWNSLKILIAEDNLVNQKVLKRILERLEVENITIVGDGAEAVKQEAEQEFDIVLMDMQMPIMDGIDACKEIHKREGGHPIAKVVFVTAHVVDSFKQTCLDNGAIGFISKPCTKKDVEDVLQQAMWYC